jgi:hypothetical protein
MSSDVFARLRFENYRPSFRHGSSETIAAADGDALTCLCSEDRRIIAA